MSRVADQMATLWPALAFLLAAVPLAALLDRLGFFEAAAVAVTARGRPTPVLALWVLATLTTIVLNLDTTVVLVTPLHLRLAGRTGADPLALAAIPLLLASLASAVLPVSNLTTLMAAERHHLDTVTVAGHLGLPSLAAVTVGWLAYRRRHPTRIAACPPERPDRRALITGGLVVAAVLVGFVFGPAAGVRPWLVALAADGMLVLLTRHLPWREVPVATAAGVAAVAAGLALTVPATLLTGALAHEHPSAVAGLTLAGAGAANLVDNLPAVLLALGAQPTIRWGLWAWLLGATVGAVLLPVGALANLLWLRIVRRAGLAVSWPAYVRLVLPIGLPALAAATLTLAAQRLVLAGW